MRTYELIEKKKRGLSLSAEEISEAVRLFTEGKIPDSQMAALLMAIYFRGMTDAETACLTEAIKCSGHTVDLSAFGTLTVDKHSTGGVGDKTTLIIAPIAAAAGATVAKMSGRGLGHTGGTVDKLESFPGFRTDLTPEEFYSQVERIGIAVIGQSMELAPADKKLYALRDITATVDSIPLICSSIMGKKLAAGSHSIVLDVKCGRGAFMKDEKSAELLAERMIATGRLQGKKMAAVITDMESPLGYAVGNALEVAEAISVLRGEGPRDLLEVSLTLSALMIELALGLESAEAQSIARDALFSGKALEKFREWISAQGGDATLIDNTELFKKADYIREIISESEGYVQICDAEAVGTAAMMLGAGRAARDDKIDHAAGVMLCKKPGDRVLHGEILARLYTCDQSRLEAAEKMLNSAYVIGDKPPSPRATVYKVLT